jgi:hypothetical protein
MSNRRNGVTDYQGTGVTGYRWNPDTPPPRTPDTFLCSDIPTPRHPDTFFFLGVHTCPV